MDAEIAGKKTSALIPPLRCMSGSQLLVYFSDETRVRVRARAKCDYEDPRRAQAMFLRPGTTKSSPK